MKRNFLIAGFLLVALSPLACQKNYTVQPLPQPSAKPTVTATPTITPTPTPLPTLGCGFTLLSNFPTPITAATGPVSTTLVIKTLSDWQNYYGSASAPAPPVTLGSQMILVNLQTIAQNTSTPVSVTNMGSPIPGVFQFTVAVQNVCWTSAQVMVSYSNYVFPSCGTFLQIPVIITPQPGTLTPTPTSTFTPTPTPTPAPLYNYYDTVAVAVPYSNLPVTWSLVGTVTEPIAIVCPG